MGIRANLGDPVLICAGSWFCRLVCCFWGVLGGSCGFLVAWAAMGCAGWFWAVLALLGHSGLILDIWGALGGSGICWVPVGFMAFAGPGRD